jgi:hypothetical protein
MLTDTQLKEALQILDDLWMVSGSTKITQLTFTHGEGVVSHWVQLEPDHVWRLRDTLP